MGGKQEWTFSTWNCTRFVFAACPAQEETAVPVLSLRLSFAGDVSSGVPSRGGAGLQEGSCRGQLCCGWVSGCPCGSRGSGGVWDRIPGACFQLAVRAVMCQKLCSHRALTALTLAGFADLQCSSALLLLFCYLLPVALWQHFVIQSPFPVRAVGGMCSAGFALWAPPKAAPEMWEEVTESF